MGTELVLRGTVSSGFGEGKYFTQLDWVVEAFRTALGFVPYPGTLNLDITTNEWQSLVTFGRDSGVTIAPTDGACCSAVCFSVQINDQIDGAIVMPEVTKHPAGKLEIIAPVHIKKTLGLVDGDVVTLKLKKSEVE
ncbi:MAG: DUF120 domain-containing protein [Thermincola sp.]|jgi:CTP-dependent riboflavin kinase|nr:DUF120 domain-containing protein [Thermincola sp.]MDT3701850.1 DUF120 domain-containing protein [Thermincola sp.]